jgi:hypothetical protein
MGTSTLATSASARETAFEWHEGDPPPPGYQYEEHIRVGEVATGSAMLGVSYLVSFIVATGGVLHPTPELAAMYVPIAGPIITLVLGATSSNDCCIGTGGFLTVMYGFGLVIDAALQITGATLLFHGLLSKKHVLAPIGHPPGFRIAPIASARVVGLSLNATF